MRSYLILSIIFLTAAMGCAAEVVVPAVPEDPVLWTAPAQRPPFRAIKIGSEDFKTRMVAVGKAYDAFVENREKLPPSGYCVESMEPDSAAKKLGLKALDVITKIDGEDISKQHLKDGKPHTIVVHRYGQAPRTVEVPIGGLGIWQTHFTRDELPAFAVDPNPKWDEHITNFKRAFTFDPELAELELYRSIAAGLQENEHTDFWFARLALMQLNYARAMDFAWLAIEGGEKDELARKYFLFAASASYKLGALNDMLKRESAPDEGRSGTVERLLAAHDAVPAGKREVLSPLAEAASLLKDDLTLRLENRKGTEDQSLPWVAQAGEFNAGVMTDHYRLISFGPAVADMEMSCSFTLKNDRLGPNAYARLTRFDFVSAAGHRKVLSVGLGETLHLATGDPEIYAIVHTWPLIMKNPRAVHTLKMAVLHGRGEAYVDGVRVFYAPVVMPDQPMEVVIHVCGMDAEIYNLRSDQLLSEDTYKSAIKDEPNALFSGGQTRLHRAAERGLMKEVELLLAAGADPKIQDGAGRTPVHLAARAGHLDVLRLLLQHGGVADFVAAGVLGDEKMLAALNKKPAYNADIRWSALHGAAAGNQVALVKALLGTQAINASTAGLHETPLMWAARLGQKEMVSLLIENGADATLKDHRNRTAADFARWNGFEDLAKSLDAPNSIPVRPKRPPPDQF